MKKVITIIALLLCLIPFNIYAKDKTLGDLKNELASLKNQKAQNDSAKKKTENEIANENNKIKNAHDAVDKAESDIETAKLNIEKSNKEIAETKNETEEILVFYQIMLGNNNYAEYISGATSITDLIMRGESISQIIKYNQDKLSSLEKKITENEELQVELAKKQVELEANIKSYEASLEGLNNDLSSLTEINLDINSQISAQQKLITYYENVGCKDNDLLSVCTSVSDNAGWLKPLEKGLITSGFGYRSYNLNGRTKTDYHNGVDIGANAGGTTVYATAAGTVAAVIYKSSCGGNQVFLHVRVQGVEYTVTYAHLLSVNVSVGDSVTNQSVIGTLGGGGSTLRRNGGWDTCSTGYHLHYGVAKGFYLGSGYSNYSKFVANCITPPGMPGYGSRFYSRY